MPSKSIAIPQRLTPQGAIQLQNKLGALVSRESAIPERIRYIVGADCSYSNRAAVGAAVMCDYETLKPIETTIVKAQVTFPYIPGLLAFREGPVVIRAIRKLRHRPDVCMVDGHGLAHPRRFGLACYVGVLTDLPTIGVAKSRLFGTDVGESLVDADGNVIATILQFKEKKRLYVSIGHRISLEDATRIAKACITIRGLEPILLAHQEATKIRWSPKT